MKDSIKILFVEDVIRDAELNWRVIEKNGIAFKKLLVDNRKDFLEGLKSFKPDIIISDYSMPQFDGMKALLLRNELAPQTPFIVVTGSVNEEVAVECMKAGADDYVIKEHLTRLPFAIKEALEQRTILLEKRAAELLLKENEEKLQSIFKAAPVGIGLVVGRVFIEINDTFCIMTGYSRSELIGKDVETIYSEDDQNESVGIVIYRHIAERGTGSVETHFKCKDGRILNIFLSSTPLDKNDLTKGVTFIAMNITERKKAEEALLESQQLFQTLAQVSPVGIFRTNHDGYTTYLNPEYLELTGLTFKEAIGFGWINAVHPDDQEILKGNWLSDIQFKKTSSAEYRFLRSDKSIVWVLGDAVPEQCDNEITGYIGTITNITERKLAEDELKNSLSLMEATLESIHNGILVVSHQGKVIKTNTKFAELWHIPKDILVSGDDNTLLNFVIEQLADPDEFIVKVRELYEKPKLESIDLINFKDGRIFERISKPMYLEGEPKGRVWSFLDITERIRSEEELKQSELRFKQISENSGEWIWEVDKNGLYTYSSSIVKDILGYEPKEIVNKKYFYDLFTPESRDQLKQAAMDAFARKENFSNLINTNLHKDGSKVILSTSALPMLDNSGNLTGYRGVDTNITAQKLAEETIIHDRRMLRTLIDNLPDMIYVKDADCKKIIANKADVKNIGYASEEDVIGLTDLDLFSGDTGLRGFEDDLKVINSGEPIIDNEEDFVDSNGDRRWLNTSKFPLADLDGKITGLVGIGHDITLRKKSEEELKQSYIFNESLLKTIPFGMDIVDETGTVLFQSDNFKQIFGEDAIGKKCWILYRDDKKQCSDCPLRKGITVGETEAYVSYGVLGNRIFEIIHTGMIYNGKKAMLEIFQDITERKINEAELISAKKKAEESDDLKTAFLHNISHEIRTPMNAIVGFSALLGEPEVDSETQQSYIETIMQSSNHLLAIISDIVDISNIEANLVKTSKNGIDINLLLKSLCNQFQPKALEKGIKLTCESGLENSETLIIADSTKLTQVISNLINNALKFTDEGSVILYLQKVENFLYFSVTDTGIGIPHEYQERIFDRFFQVNNTVSRIYEGTGLGLAISKAYVELMGGKIWLSSDPGTGAIFQFTIPYEKQAVAVLPEVERSAPEVFVFKRKIRILVAEDDDGNFKLIKYFLSGANAEIIRAVNGKEAVDKTLSEKNIDLIFMDIRMPVMDGYTAINLIREANIKIPIVAQTAYIDDRDKAISAGCDGFISKPFDKKKLLEVLSEFN